MGALRGRPSIVSPFEVYFPLVASSVPLLHLRTASIFPLPGSDLPNDTTLFYALLQDMTVIFPRLTIRTKLLLHRTLLIVDTPCFSSRRSQYRPYQPPIC